MFEIGFGMGDSVEQAINEPDRNFVALTQAWGSPNE